MSKQSTQQKVEEKKMFVFEYDLFGGLVFFFVDFMSNLEQQKIMFFFWKCNRDYLDEILKFTSSSNG